MKFVLTAILLASPGMLFAAPPDVASVSGVWKITGDVHGRPVDMTCQLTEIEQRLSGTCTRAAESAEPHHIDGTVNGGKLQFHLQTALNNRPITLLVNGKLNADDSRLTGELQVEPLGVSGKFQGQREADATTAENQPPTPPPAPPAPAETQPSTPTPEPASQTATGRWKVDADFQGTAAELICSFNQDGKALTGTCTGEDSKPRPLKGEVNEHGFTWKFDTEYQGQPITVTMTARLTPDGTMRGEASVAPLNADGVFTAKRPPSTPAQPETAPPTAGTPPAQ